jgi:hypothetical protein
MSTLFCELAVDGNSWLDLGLSRDCSVFAGLEGLAVALSATVEKLEELLSDGMWTHIEGVVRAAARSFKGPVSGMHMCVPAFDGEWIVGSDNRLVRPTQSELKKYPERTRWTPLNGVLGP